MTFSPGNVVEAGVLAYLVYLLRPLVPALLAFLKETTAQQAAHTAQLKDNTVEIRKLREENTAELKQMRGELSRLTEIVEYAAQVGGPPSLPMPIEGPFSPLPRRRSEGGGA